MRRLSMFLLLASAAVPALAAPGDGDRGSRHERGQRAEKSDSQPQRTNRERRSGGGEQRSLENRRSGGGDNQAREVNRQGSMERMREHYARQQAERQQATNSTSSNDRNTVRSLRRGDRQGDSTRSTSSWRPRERQVRTIPDTQPNVTRTQRRGELARAFEGRPRPDYRNGDYRRWSTNHWRNDHRYDWRRWRDRNRSIFRLGFYYDPFGWSYRRWSIGSFLYPSYYGSNFWLDDPWRYRLPPAYGPYRWVRYWDDALLVNTYTGQVVDVIHNFFW